MSSSLNLNLVFWDLVLSLRVSDTLPRHKAEAQSEIFLIDRMNSEAAPVPKALGQDTAVARETCGF